MTAVSAFSLVAVGQTVCDAAAMHGTGQGLNFQFHQPLCGEADHFAQEVGVGGLFQ